MKIIKVPRPVAVIFKPRGFLRQDGREPEPITKEFGFKDFVCAAVEGTELFGKGLKNIRKGSRIIAGVESMDGKPELALEEEDYQALKDAVEGFAWSPPVAMQCLSYFEAIEKAEDVKT